MQPMNYSLNVEQPFMSALQGYKAGAAIRDDQQQQQALIAQQQAQQQMQYDLADLLANPSAGAREYAAVTVKYPSLREPLKQAFDMLDEQQRSASIDLSSRAYAALSSGRADVAERMLRDRVDVMRGSGAPEEEVRAQEFWADMIRDAPTQARAMGGLMLSSVLGPEKFAETFAKLGEEGRAADEAPYKLDKVKSEASSAATTAKFAESKAVMDLRMSEEQIKKWAADTQIAKENSRIAAMNASIARENNDLKRQELLLKRDDAITARDDKLRAKFSDYQVGQATLQDALGLLTEIRSDPDTLGAATGGSAWRAAIPGTASRTLAGKIEQLQNTLAASNLEKLKGPMSDKDIAFLKNISSNLDRYQSESGFKKELQKVEDILIRADKQLRNQYGPGITSKPAPAIPGGESAAPAQNRNVTVDW